MRPVQLAFDFSPAPVCDPSQPLGIEDFIRAVLGVELNSFQQEYLRALDRNPEQAVFLGRRAGLRQAWRVSEHLFSVGGVVDWQLE